MMLFFLIISFSLASHIYGMEQSTSSSSSFFSTGPDLPKNEISISLKSIPPFTLTKPTICTLYENSSFFRERFNEFKRKEINSKKPHAIELSDVSSQQFNELINISNWAQGQTVDVKNFVEKNLDLYLKLGITPAISSYVRYYLANLLSDKSLEQIKKDEGHLQKLNIHNGLVPHLIREITNRRISSFTTATNEKPPIELFRQARANQIKPQFLSIENEATQIATNSTGQQLAVGDKKGFIHLFELPNGKKMGELAKSDAYAHHSEIKCLTYHPTDENMLLSACVGGKIIRWNTKKNSILAVFNKSFPIKPISALHYASNETIVSAGPNGNIFIWNHKFDPAMQEAVAPLNISAIYHDPEQKKHYATDGKLVKIVELNQDGKHTIKDIPRTIQLAQKPYLDYMLETIAKEGKTNIPNFAGLPNPDTSLGQYAVVSPGVKGEKETTIDVRCSQSQSRKFALVIGTKEIIQTIEKILFAKNGEALIVFDNNKESVKILNIKHFNDLYCRLTLMEAIFLYMYLVLEQKEIATIKHFAPIAEKFGLANQDDVQANNNNNNNAPTDQMKALTLNKKS